MEKIYPTLLQADLWGHDDPLGKSLDALFSLDSQDIVGVLMDYNYIQHFVIASGPAMMACRNQGDILLKKDFPEDDMIAAALGRVMQNIFSANHICEYITKIDFLPDDAESGYSLSALFTESGLILFQDDPFWVLETYCDDIKTAAPQLCTLALKPSKSAHHKLDRANALARDLGVFNAIHGSNLKDLEAEEYAQFIQPDVINILPRL